jgi:hypothetical protein
MRAGIKVLCDVNATGAIPTSDWPATTTTPVLGTVAGQASRSKNHVFYKEGTEQQHTN